METNSTARAPGRGQPAIPWPPFSQGGGSGAPLGGTSFHRHGAGRHPAGSGHGFVAPFCRSCTWGNWQQEPTFSGPRLEMVITEQKEPLVARGQCQAYFLLHQGAPQERPVLSSTPSQAQIIEKFSMQAESTFIAAWSLLGSGFAWIGSDREAGLGQRWVWQTEGVIRGGSECAVLFVPKEQLCCPGMTPGSFWYLLADGLLYIFWGVEWHSSCGICRATRHSAFLLVGAEGRGRCGAMGLGGRRNVLQNMTCCRAGMGALGYGWADRGCRSVMLPEWCNGVPCMLEHGAGLWGALCYHWHCSSCTVHCFTGDMMWTDLVQHLCCKAYQNDVFPVQHLNIWIFCLKLMALSTGWCACLTS